MADYSQLSESQLRQALLLFGIEYAESAFIDGGLAKTNYRVTDSQGQRFVFTVADSERNLPAETTARLLRFVSQHGVITSEPVDSMRGSLLEEFEGHRVLVKRYVEGVTSHDLPFAHLRSAGQNLARVHLFPVPDWLPQGTRRMDDVTESVEMFDDKSFAAWVLEHIDETASMFTLDEPFTINHGDYFADNLVVTPSGDIAVLDWDTASCELPVVDLGFAIVGLALTGTSLNVGRLREFLAGYEGVRALSPAERAHLQASSLYAAAVLAHHRYRRFHIVHPEPGKFDAHVNLQHIAESLKADWPR